MRAHTCTGARRPLNTHLPPPFTSASAQVLDEQGTGKIPNRAVLISLPKWHLPDVLSCAWLQFGLQPLGKCSPGSYPLLSANCLPSFRSQLKGHFCRETSPAQRKSGPHSCPTFLMPKPWSQACMLTTIWPVIHSLFIAACLQLIQGLACNRCSLNIC